MTAPRVDAAEAAAVELRAADIPAYTDPAAAAANLPAVLFLPPSVRFPHLAGGAEVDWRLAILTRPPHGLDAWRQLDQLLEQLADHLHIVTAEPGSYALTGGENKPPLPAYLVTATS